jgi:hypothetical protein
VLSLAAVAMISGADTCAPITLATQTAWLMRQTTMPKPLTLKPQCSSVICVHDFRGDYEHRCELPSGHRGRHMVWLWGCSPHGLLSWIKSRDEQKADRDA